ncbi:MAG: hypothetical protein II103_02700 [Treponema sp.]|nr:hypothetical protein [Treponema sp.]
MEFVLHPTTETSSDEIVMNYLDKTKSRFEIPDKNNLSKIVFGLTCVPERLRIFHPDKPYMSYKLNAWGTGVYLDYKYVCSDPPFEELDKYVKKCICDRIDELKTVKTLRGIKDRSTLDDIKKLFVQQ